MIPNLPSDDDGVRLQHPKRELRLRMKPDTAARGSVDGGWWPWSTDAATEFPALAMALSSWGGPAREMAYNPDDWQPTERTLTVEGWTVRLEGSRSVPPNTVTFTGSTLKRIHLLVVPPWTPGGVARASLRAAAGSDTTAAIAEILVSKGLSRDDGRDAEPCR